VVPISGYHQVPAKCPWANMCYGQILENGCALHIEAEFCREGCYYGDKITSSVFLTNNIGNSDGNLVASSIP